MGKPSNARKKEVKKEDFQSIDEFIEYQLAEYIKIHKKHEKEISYIG